MTALLVAGLLIFAGLAVFLKDMLKAVLCLLISSVFLGIIFFKLNAPYAGVFEISVVAGLIVVLFILTVSITGPQDTVSEPNVHLLVFFVLLSIFLYAINIAIIKMFACDKIPISSKDYFSLGEALWIGRTFDMIGQICVIFSGVFVLLLILSRRKNDK
ncbi:MAG: hypothetical protein N2115_06085 [bacterium]|nr:hypothetical protein [bacterium]